MQWLAQILFTYRKIALSELRLLPPNRKPKIEYRTCRTFASLPPKAVRRVTRLRLAQKMLKRKLQKNDALIAFSVTANPTTETSE
jgi:hypothetical protein